MTTLAEHYGAWPQSREIIMNLSRMAPNMRANADYYLANPKGKTEADLALEIEADADQFLLRLGDVEALKVQAPDGYAAALTVLGIQEAEIASTIGTLKAATNKIKADMRKPQKDIVNDVGDFKAAIPVYAEPMALEAVARTAKVK